MAVVVSCFAHSYLQRNLQTDYITQCCDCVLCTFQLKICLRRCNNNDNNEPITGSNRTIYMIRENGKETNSRAHTLLYYLNVHTTCTQTNTNWKCIEFEWRLCDWSKYSIGNMWVWYYLEKLHYLFLFHSSLFVSFFSGTSFSIRWRWLWACSVHNLVSLFSLV